MPSTNHKGGGRRGRLGEALAPTVAALCLLANSAIGRLPSCAVGLGDREHLGPAVVSQGLHRSLARAVRHRGHSSRLRRAHSDQLAVQTIA